MAAPLILGGKGFIGSHLSRALAAAGQEPRVFDRPQEFLAPAQLDAALAGVEVVFHLISSTVPKNSNDDPMADIEANVVGTLRLLDLCRRRKVRKVVFISSGGTVYGVPRGTPISESHPTEPICSYGIHKLAIEKYLHLNWSLHGLDYCVLRVANAYGEGQRTDAAQGAVAAFLERAVRGSPIEIWGDGSVVRDYVYVGDIVQALLKAAAHRGERKVFNIGSGVGVSLNELVREIGKIVGRTLEVRYAPGRGFDVPANVLDATAAREQLGWRPSTSLPEGLRRTYDRVSRA
ncbi:MAG: NAD-dependent epimerase [Burkholderiales bacterium]|nr:NAD-dependent epimerase [Burkholderiales bacterium]